MRYLLFIALLSTACSEKPPTAEPSVRDARIPVDAAIPDASLDAGLDELFPPGIDVDVAVTVITVTGRLSLHRDYITPDGDLVNSFPIVCRPIRLWDAGRGEHDAELCAYLLGVSPQREVVFTLTGSEAELRDPRMGRSTFQLEFPAVFETEIGNAVPLYSDQGLSSMPRSIPWRGGAMRVVANFGDGTAEGGTGLTGLYGDSEFRNSNIRTSARVIEANEWAQISRQ